MSDAISQAAALIKKSSHTSAFTGAGISVESGIPPFRGEHGIWNKYDPKYLDIGYFYSDPIGSWKVIREIFYDHFNTAKPNRAHEVLAEMERRGFLEAVITQNIDNLHQEAGSQLVFEYHGNSQQLVCQECGATYKPEEVDMTEEIPRCKNEGYMLKPDFIFFGEGIPETAALGAIDQASKAEVFLVIGSTGEVMPACMVPHEAKRYGAKIIEINPEESLFTPAITDIHLRGRAAEVLESLAKELYG